MNFSGYARALNMPDYLTYSTGFWRYIELHMYQVSEYDAVLYVKVTQSFEYVWISFNIPQ